MKKKKLSPKQLHPLQDPQRLYDELKAMRNIELKQHLDEAKTTYGVWLVSFTLLMKLNNT